MVPILVKLDELLKKGELTLVIVKSSDLVNLFKQNDMERLGRSFGDFNDFLIHYVLGRKYEEIVRDVDVDDEWYQFLIREEFV